MFGAAASNLFRQAKQCHGNYIKTQFSSRIYYLVRAISSAEFTMPPKRKSTRAADATASKKAKQAEWELKFDEDWSGHGLRAGASNLPPVFVLSGPAVQGSSKIAAFDLDMTLIVPASGKTFPQGPNDWKIINDEVKPKLEAVHKDGFKIVIITNQRGMEKGHTDPMGWQKKVNRIINELNIPIQVFVATGENDFRKPGTKMWDMMVKLHNDGIQPDMSASYYVGDAAGRAKDWAPGKKRDFSCGDRMFAANVGIHFKTPEEYFFGETPPLFDWHSINPAEVLKGCEGKHKESYHSKDKELIIMVGFPASGKSTIVKKYLLPHGYVHVNRDTLQTQAKCISAVKDAIKAGENVVVDNTNPSADARADYIKIATDAKYKVRCFVMDTSRELANHLNFMRQTQTDGKVRRVPKVGYNVYKKNYKEPVKSEGLDDIVKIPFQPIFKSDKDKALFQQWTCE